MKNRIYELYVGCPGGRPTNKSIDYHSGMWIAEIRATSIKQAYAILYAQSFSKSYYDIGIVGMDNSSGPGRGWPWKGRPCSGPDWTRG